jgi:acetylglutamate kinase
MRPKMEACLRAVESGVERANIIDGRIKHACCWRSSPMRAMGTMVRAAEPDSGGMMPTRRMAGSATRAP